MSTAASRRKIVINRRGGEDMDNIKERADEICVFLIDNPEAETFDLLELL